MVEYKNGNKLRRHVTRALVPAAALLFGSSAAFATTWIGHSSGPSAIGGTGLDAIGGTGLDAIGGTGRAKGRAIGGTGSDAIGGTGLDAIGGTGLDAIGGTGRAKGRAIGGTGTDAIGGTGGPQLMILGPIESVDQTRGTITIFGRQLQLPMGQAGARIIERYLSGESLQLAVFGTLSNSGRIAGLRATIAPVPYVPGVSEVVLTGVVQAVDLATGQAVVNGVAVSYASLLETGATTIKVGSVVTVRGTMSQMGQAVEAAVVVIFGR